MALEKIILQYDLDLKALKKDFDKVKSQLRDVEKKVKQSSKRSSSAFNGMGQTMKAVFGGLTVAALASEMKQLISESVNLARQAVGVKTAFANLNDPTLLSDLRRATGGTVSDLELMRKAVQAKNFKLPLDKLATMMEFAGKRARQTGEDVDFMVQSIVLGLSRGSIKILDNLGLSVTELREKTKEYGTLTKGTFALMDEQLKEMGGNWDTSADKMDRANASIENLKLTFGEALLPVLGDVADITDKWLNMITDDRLSAWDKLFATVGGTAGQMAAYGKQLALTNIEEADRVAKIDEVIEEIRKAEIQQKTYNKETEQGAHMFSQYGKRIQALKIELISLGHVLEKEDDSFKENTDTIAGIKEAIDFWGKALEGAGVKSAGYMTALSEIHRLTNLLNAAMKPWEKKTIPEALFAFDEKDFERVKLGVEEFLEVMGVTGGELRNIEVEVGVSPRNMSTQRWFDFLEPEGMDEIEKSVVENIEEIDRQSAELRLQNANGKFQTEAAFNIQLLNLEQERINEEMRMAEVGSEAWLDLKRRESEILNEIQEERFDKFVDTTNKMLQISGAVTQIGIDMQNLQGKSQSEMSEFQKVTALVGITIATAQSIANAISSAKGGTVFDYIAQIAVGVAAVTSAMVQAKTLLKGAGDAEFVPFTSDIEIPQFAKGVIGLKGSGTKTSDSNLARLSVGESIMTADETSQFKQELQAIRDGDFNDLLMRKYILPTMVAQTSNNGSSYDDFNLRQAIKGNKSVEVRNANAIGKSVAENMSASSKITRWYS